MVWMRRHAALLLVGGLSWLVGCSQAAPGEPPSPSPSPTDLGDWVDTGRLAACDFNTGGAVCGDPDFFQLSACDKGSLASIPRDGVYTALYRVEPPGASSPVSPFVSSFRVSESNLENRLRQYRPWKQVGPEGFFLSAEWTSGSRVIRHSISACRAEGRRIHGCFVYCRDGQVSSKGTFMAERAARPDGEAEASGLRLVSESAVAQGRPVDVYVAQGHAYVVSIDGPDRVGGLSTFDVSNKAAPVLTSTVHHEGNSYWNGVWAKDDVLYVASNTLGVMVFDASVPSTPRFVRSYPSSNMGLSVHTVFVDGDRLYAMSNRPVPKTFIFDVSNPLSPVLLGEHAVPGAGQSGDTGYPHDAFAFEGRLYINHWSDGLLVVDVSDPANTKLLGAYGYAFARSHASAVGRFGERVIAFEGGETWGAHLRVLDVTDPASPRRIGEYRLDPRASIHNMVLQGTRLYIAYYQHGVRVLDVSTPESPRELAHYFTYRETDPFRGQSFYEGALGIRVPGDGYVYVVDDSRGLLLFPELP